MQILVVNCGSATLKYKLIDFAGPLPHVLARGAVTLHDAYGAAVRDVIRSLGVLPDAIAHRIVHGGERATSVALVDDAVLRELRQTVPLAPLHNGPAIEAIEATMTLGVPLVAAFDTAFHRTLPEVAWRYAVPVPPSVRRYGFHGWSHRYVTERYAVLAQSPTPTIVTLHLGSGCSAAAIRDGRSVDTSMGYSPLEGLVMGTRAGDLDPAVVIGMMRDGLSPGELERLLHHDAGLRALAGIDDMRLLLQRTDPAAAFAIELFCYRIRKYVGAYLAVLEGAEAVVFTGGIGEHSSEIRRRVCEHFGWAGLVLDEERNMRGDERISADGARLAAYAIPTDEESLIAREAALLLGISPENRHATPVLDR